MVTILKLFAFSDSFHLGLRLIFAVMTVKYKILLLAQGGGWGVGSAKLRAFRSNPAAPFTVVRVVIYNCNKHLQTKFCLCSDS
jgi:hypothetical protein